MVANAEHKKKMPKRGNFFLYILNALTKRIFVLPGQCQASFKSSQKIFESLLKNQ